MVVDLEIPDASVYLIDFEYTDAFSRLRDELDWKQEFINIYGKTIPQPRLTAWYGKSYTYSGIKNEPQPMPEILLDIQIEMRKLLEYDFNSVLANYYVDGKHSIGFHSDDEKELGQEPVIASLSFGGTRLFKFKHKYGKHPDVEIELVPNQILLMMGKTQTNWNHGIDKVKQAQPRINLTYRRII